METLIFFEGDEPRDVHISNAKAALAAGLEPAAEFYTPDNQKHIVRQSNFDAAFKQGLKPVDHKEMGIWEAFKTGVSAGMQPAGELAAGMTGFPFAAPEQEVQAELEKSQAWEEHPIAYGAGKAIPTIGAIGAGALAARGAQKAGSAAVQGAKPYVGPSVQAAQQEYRSTMASPSVPDVMGVTKPLTAGAAAIRGAIKQIPETRREAADLAKLEQASPNREAGAINPQNQRLYLGQEILEPGMTPEKQAIAERAVSFAPSRLRTEPLSEAFAMGTTRRQQARSFLPEVAAEEIAPGLARMQKELGKKSGEYYAPLHEQAASEYKPEQGRRIPQEIKYIRMGADETEGVSSQAKQALDITQQIVEIAPDTYRKRGLSATNIPWDSIDPKEQYKRIQVARQVLNKTISQMSSTQDKTILNEPSRNLLEQAKYSLDGVLKSFPSQRKADQAYAAASSAMSGLFEGMEFGKGDKKKIDVPAVKKLFGNNDKAYRIQEGVDTMRQFLDKFGDDIAPNKRQEMQAVVDKFDSLRKQAEDKRLLQGLEYGQGPSSPAIERTSALREAKGLPSDIFTSPATALNAADEFMASRSQRYFNNRFEELVQPQKNKMIRLLMWRQQNPNATLTDEESMFKKILKGK